MTTVYLAGPMSGIPHFNYPLFDEVTGYLREMGFEVISPAENNRALFPGVEQEPGFEEGKGEDAGSERRTAVMKDDFHSVLVSDAIALLPGWEASSGATEERTMAETIGLPIYLIVSGASVGVPMATWVVIPDEEQVRLDHRPWSRRNQVANEIRVDVVANTEQFEEALKRISEQIDGADSRVREFTTGATRDATDHKHDYEGYFSPLALRALGEYMFSHRFDSNGNPRASDNWQQGMPLEVYMKSLWRHLMDTWQLHRGLRTYDFDGHEVSLETALCGVLFNAFGYLHELLMVDQPQRTK